MHIRRLTRLILLQNILSALRKSQIVRSDQIFAVWSLPFARLPRLDFQQEHRIDFLQRSTRGLGQQEVYHHNGYEVARGEEVAVRKANVFNDEFRRESYEEVESPVRRGTEGDTSTPVSRRIDLGGDSPGHGTPCAGEGCNEKASEDDHDISYRSAVGAIWTFELEVAEGCKDHEAHEHPRCTEGEALSAAVLLDHVETRESGDNVDGAENDLRDERVV